MNRISQACSTLLFLLWCASLTYWTLYFTTPPSHQVASLSVHDMTKVSLTDAMSLLGGGSNNENRIPLFLSGVILSGESGASLAIIGAPGATQRVIRRGAELMPGITLQEIHAKYIVVLDHGLQREVPLSLFSSVPQSTLSTTYPINATTRAEVPGQQPLGLRMAPPSQQSTGNSSN